MNDHPTKPAVVEGTTVIVPVADIIAMRNLQDYRSSELARIQKRSDKWIGGMVALTGVLTTAIVIKGPETFVNLANAPFIGQLMVNVQLVVILLMAIGFVALGFGVFWAHSAAYGDPFETESDLDRRAEAQQVTGAWSAWTGAVSTAADKARQTLAKSVQVTIVGTGALALAVFVTWTTPAATAASEDSFTCFLVGDARVKIEGNLPKVLEGPLEFVAC